MVDFEADRKITIAWSGKTEDNRSVHICTDRVGCSDRFECSLMISGNIYKHPYNRYWEFNTVGEANRKAESLLKKYRGW